ESHGRAARRGRGADRRAGPCGAAPDGRGLPGVRDGRRDAAPGHRGDAAPARAGRQRHRGHHRPFGRLEPLLRRRQEVSLPSPRLLLLLPSTTYRAAAFVEAARRLDVTLSVASERPSTFERAQPAGLLTLDFAAP